MDTITYIFLMGCLMGIAFIWPVHKLSMKVRRILNGYAFLVDLCVGAIMAALFFGTQGGMVIATIATVLFTAYLSWSIHTIGKLKLTRHGWK